MNTVRSFIALDFPVVVINKVNAVIQELSRAIPRGTVRWVPAANLHLTLKFLGDTTSSQSTQIKDILSDLASSITPFQITVIGSGMFPNAYRPKTLWIGIKSPADLRLIAKEIDKQVASVGILMESRPFSPHLTIGRVPSDLTAAAFGQLNNHFSSVPVGNLGSYTVDHLTLYKSDLRPTGATYTELAKYPFNKDNNQK